MTAERSVPAWVRLWHWITAILFLVLTLTGLILHFAAPGFIPMDYAMATTLHDVSGIALAIAYGLHLLYLFATGYGRQYLPARGGLWGRLKAQVVYYVVGMARDEWGTPILAAGTRFNALQQLTYFLVIFGLLPLLVATGLIYLYPDYAPREILGFDGLWPVALVHYALGILGTVYLITHIYLATTSPSSAASFRLITVGRAETTQNG
jgi:thiosulfate reductase cytochrome b subunit